MGITENLGLSTYNTASGSATTFLTFRLAVAGTESNMELIDEYAGWVSGSIVEIESNLLVNVGASLISANYYEATVSAITSYLTDSMIALEVNVSNTDAVTLNINELGTVTLKKVGSDGELTDLESGDLKADRHTLFVYDGTYYVLMGATTADQVNIYGNEDNFVSISGSGTLQDSGISGSSILSEISGSGVMSGTSGSVVDHNVSGITSGSYNKVQVDTYGHITSGSQLEYQTESDVWGAGIMSDTSGSAVAHNTSAVTSGSYSKVEVDDYGHVISGSQIEYLSEISGSGIMSDSSGSIVKHNESSITSGSYNKIEVDGYGHVVSGSQLEYQTESEISGSGVMSDSSGSVVAHNESGISSGSYIKVEVDSYGHVTSGSATAWNDLFFPLTATKQGSNTYPVFDEDEVAYLFPQNDTSHVAYIIAQIPHDWAIGTDISPHVHWKQTQSGSAVFKIDYKWVDNGAGVPSGYQTYVMDDNTFEYTSGSILQLTSGSATISGSDISGVSSMMLIKLYRDDNDYAGDAVTYQFDIHIQKDSIGSSEIYTK